MRKQNVPYANKKLYKLLGFQCEEEFKFSPIYPEVKRAVHSYNLMSRQNQAVKELECLAKKYENVSDEYYGAIHSLISYIRLH